MTTLGFHWFICVCYNLDTRFYLNFIVLLNVDLKRPHLITYILNEIKCIYLYK